MQLRYIYLELIGPHQGVISETLWRASERFISAASRQRQIATTPSISTGTPHVLKTNANSERRHIAPISSRLLQLARTGTIVQHGQEINQDRDICNRILTITHAFETAALWGLRIATSHLMYLPDSDYLGYDLAPATLESGTRYPDSPDIKDPGLDILMTWNDKRNDIPRNPILGINIKANKGRVASTNLWYSPRISRLALNLHVGLWTIPDDEGGALHDRLKRAAKSDDGTCQLLALVEHNIKPLGQFTLQQLANGVFQAKLNMEGHKLGKRDRGILMAPPNSPERDLLFAQVNQLSSLFEANGIHLTRQYHRPYGEGVYQQLPAISLQQIPSLLAQ